MARPFAYHTGSQIPGTQKFGNLTVATSSQNFSGGYGGVRWFNGPDESIGWVLGFAREGNQQPGFIRTDNKTDEEFLSMVNNLPKRRGQTAFTSGTQAKTWLNSNGFWTNWESLVKRVLFLGDTTVGTVASNIDAYITGTGNQITATTQTLGTSYDGSDISTNDFDVVLMYTNGGQTGSASLPGNLVNFVNAGGSLVTGVFLWNIYPSGFDHSQITAFQKTDSQSHPAGGSIIITSPTAITNGIGTTMPTFFDNGNPSLSSGATLLATYSDGDNLLAVKTVGSSTLVSINAAPLNINSSSSTITKMFGNAILYAGGVI